MKRLIYYIFLGMFLSLFSCTKEDTTLVCGVKVKGTPWELAAAINDNGDGTFVPEKVNVYTDKAYIDGWFNTNVTDNPYTAEPYDDGFVPAQVVCDVKDGMVTHAIVYCEILDKE